MSFLPVDDLSKVLFFEVVFPLLKDSLTEGEALMKLELFSLSIIDDDSLFLLLLELIVLL